MTVAVQTPIPFASSLSPQTNATAARADNAVSTPIATIVTRAQWTSASMVAASIACFLNAAVTKSVVLVKRVGAVLQTAGHAPPISTSLSGERRLTTTTESLLRMGVGSYLFRRHRRPLS